MSAQGDLRAALVKALRADADLTALTGGERVHDGAPRGGAHPFVELGPIVSRPLLSSAEVEELNRKVGAASEWSLLFSSARHGKSYARMVNSCISTSSP